MTPQQALKEYFGYDAFRAGQQGIVDAVCAGRDVMCVMPTGAGKSLCYQIPALLADGITLVISPLISLMKDQVYALTQAGVRAAYLNSSLTYGQYVKALSLAAQGTYKIIYVAPERLATEQFVQAIENVKISFIAVDEAHCVSQWGQDFRPSYLKITEFINSLPYRPVVGAYTATATDEVKADIMDILQLENPLAVTTGFDRPNLYFGVRIPRDKDSELLKLVDGFEGKSGIVYCATRKAVEEVCGLLIRHGIAAARYHAGLPDAERKQSQEDFVLDKIQIIVATNAFGMGIDKSNVSFVIHYNMPKNIESYYQEAGRAGRDGTDADCILLYSPRDVHTNRFLIENGEPNPELTPSEQQAIKQKDLERLKYMTFYCTTTQCLRAFILNYFGEKAPEACGNCSSCERGTEDFDATRIARAIIGCINDTNQRFGASLITDILHGSETARIESMRLDTQPAYGTLAAVSVKDIRFVLNALMQSGHIEATDGQYPVLTLTSKAFELAHSGESYVVKKPVEAERPQKKAKKKYSYGEGDSGLYKALKVLRMEIAMEKHVPAYVIFTDAALTDMCRVKPQTKEEFLQVSGVGEAKLRSYGARFIEAIKNYTNK